MKKNSLNLSPKQLALLKALKQKSGLQTNDLLPITRRKENQDIPVSFAQEWMWLLEQIASPAYNNSLTFKLSGKLEQTILEKSLNEIIKRHEILRTTFLFKKNLVQVITSVSAFSLPTINLSNVPEADKQEYALELVRQKTHQPFNLAQDLPFRVVLLKLSETEHWLHWTLHHIVTDDTSFSIILKELASLYESFLENASSPLPVLPFQYGDYACWQQNQIENFEQQLTYWRKQLENLPFALNLPTDRQLSKVKSFAGRQHTFSVSPQLTKLLISFSQKAQVTLFSTLLTAFYVLLYRYTQQDDVIVAVPVSLRHRPEMQDLIGVFINTVLIRCQPRDEIYFQSLLQQVHKSVVDAREHQKLPYHKLIEVLRQNNNLDSSSLIQVAFDFQTSELPQRELSNLTISPIEIDRHITTTDLTLHIANSSDSLTGYFEYSTDLFDVSTIERMAIHFQTLLEGIAENPQQQISQLPLLSEAERHKLLIEWNDTATDYPQGKCIHQLFEEQVKRTPDAVAVVFEDEKLTYRQLNNRANKLANYLRSKGVGPEVLVGICVERSIEMVVGLLGIIKAGGAYVPLDPAYPQERLTYILEDSQVSILVTQKHIIEQIPKIVPRIVFLDNKDILDNCNKNNIQVKVNAKNLAYIIYTSGSTGKPKGVAVEHKGVVNYLHFRNFEMFTEDELSVAFLTTSIGFDASVPQIFSPLSIGGKVIVLNNINQLSTWLCKEKVTCLSTVPSLLEQLIKNESLPSSLRVIALGGESVSPNLLQQLAQYENVEKVVNMYGPTEASISACTGIIA